MGNAVGEFPRGQQDLELNVKLLTQNNFFSVTLKIATYGTFSFAM